MQGTHAEAASHPVILVVEGLESLRKSMKQILEDADFLVLPAANAGQALELAKSCLPDQSPYYHAALRRDAGAGPGFLFREAFAGNECSL
jgi:hypothetical protein